MSENTTTGFRDKVEALLRPHLKFLANDEALQGDAELKGLGLDSVASINFLFDVEQQLGVMLPDERLTEDTFRTFNALEGALSDTCRADCA